MLHTSGEVRPAWLRLLLWFVMKFVGLDTFEQVWTPGKICLNLKQNVFVRCTMFIEKLHIFNITDAPDVAQQ